MLLQRIEEKTKSSEFLFTLEESLTRKKNNEEAVGLLHYFLKDSER
jgi:hypothetical protein